MSDKSTIEEIIEGLTILKAYGGDVGADHDILFTGPYSQEDVTAQDAEALEELGWHWNDEYSAWGHFV